MNFLKNNKVASILVGVLVVVLMVVVFSEPDQDTNNNQVTYQIDKTPLKNPLYAVCTFKQESMVSHQSINSEIEMELTTDNSPLTMTFDLTDIENPTYTYINAAGEKETSPLVVIQADDSSYVLLSGSENHNEVYRVLPTEGIVVRSRQMHLPSLGLETVTSSIGVCK